MRERRGSKNIGRPLRGILTAVALAFLLGPAPASATSSGDLVSQGNRSFSQGAYDEALDAYEKASVDAPESPYIYFNKGAALYMKGQYLEAAELFEQGALKSRDLSFEARSQFNRGNCFFRESERQRDSDLKKSLSELERAAEHYQKTLRLDPEFKDAAHNLEVARLTMKQILDEIKKQQEQAQKQQEKQQDARQKLKELIERQEQLQSDTKALDEVKKQTGRSEEMTQRSQDLAGDQEKLKSETQDLEKEMQGAQCPQGPPGEKAREHLSRAVSEQAKAQQELSQESLKDAQGKQEKAVEEMKKALEALKGDQGQGQQQQDQEQQAQQDKQEQQTAQGQQQQQPQEQQAASVRDEDARSLLDEERENRERRRLGVPQGHRPVDKDW